MARFQVQGEAIDFEKLGYETRLRSRDRASAEAICGLTLHAYDDEIQAKNTSEQAEITSLDYHGRSLHAHLYDRPDPVNDAEMLARNRKMRTYLALAVCAAVAALAGNAITFALYGYGILVTTLLAMCATVVPVVVGHLAFEKVLACASRRCPHCGCVCVLAGYSCSPRHGSR